MGIYLVTAVISYILAILAIRYGTSGLNNSDDVKPNRFFVVLLTITFVVISGFRYMNYFLSDEWIYREAFLKMVNNDDFLSIFTTREWGFSLLNWLLSRVSDDPQFLIFTVALLTNVLTIITIAEYGRPFELSILLYVVYGNFFTTFNIIRQCLAISIAFWGIRYVLAGQFWRYFLLVYIASTIHTSVWLVLPVYFIVRHKSLIKWSIPLFVAALLVIVNFSSVMNFFLTENSVYGYYLSDLARGSYGVNPVRVAGAYILPLGLLLFYRKKLAAININNLILINYSMISAIIMMISVMYVYIARLNTFFEIIGVIIFSQLGKVNTRMYALLAIFFFLFGLYQASIYPTYYNVLFEDIGGTLR